MPMRTLGTEHDWGAASNSPYDYVLDARHLAPRVAWLCQRPTVRELTPRSASYGWMAPAKVPESTSSRVADVNWICSMGRQKQRRSAAIAHGREGHVSKVGSPPRDLETRRLETAIPRSRAVAEAAEAAVATTAVAWVSMQVCTAT